MYPCYTDADMKMAERLNIMSAMMDRIIAEIIDMKAYMREHFATKVELKEVENRLTDHIDGFAKRQVSFESEVAALHSRTSRIEEKIA